MKGTWLPLVAAAAILAGCTDEPTTLARAPSPAAAPPAFAIAAGSGPTGAIFTTVPDGSVVNENVRYNSKLEVYLDGGPRGGSPQTAAGLDDGFYVFQITDPPGKYLLSQDPARCRVLQVKDGIIVKLWKPSELKAAGGPLAGVAAFSGTDTYVNPITGKATACQIANAPTPPATALKTDFGASGQHDTNVDVDFGANGAIVIQMMPYGTTPNPGGVYKAWVSTLDAYITKAQAGQTGKTVFPLDVQPASVKGRDAQPCPDFCAAADPGFGPPRNLLKTDNFKVKEEARLKVVKVNDLNGNGVRDDGEPTIEGWDVAFVETLPDGPLATYDKTTATRTFVPGDKVTVCEAGKDNWAFSFATGGTPAATPSVLTGTWYCVLATVGAGGSTVEVAFGNFELGSKSGLKFHDHNANRTQDGGDEALDGVTVDLLDASLALLKSTTTTGGGKYTFTGLNVGTYTVCEKVATGWAQSTAVAGDASESVVDCPAGYAAKGIRFAITTSGQKLTGNNFGNFQPVDVSGTKFIDLNGNGKRDAGEGCPATGPNVAGCYNITVHLDGTANLGAAAVHLTKQTDANGDYKFSGIVPGSYTITVDEPSGLSFTCSFPSPCNYPLNLLSGVSSTGNDFGDVAPASISGYKISDTNGDGVKAENEGGISGWKVYLFGKSGLDKTVDLTATTDGSGKFSFPNVPPGIYKLCEEQQFGFQQRYPTLGNPPNTVDCATLVHTPPLTGIGYTLTLQSADNVSVGFDFLNQPNQGCTPGFWQGGFGIDLWNTRNDPEWGPPRITNGGTNPFIQTDIFNNPPDAQYGFKRAWEVDGMTMLDIVGTGGTDVNARKTARDVIAAYLNRSAGLAYPFGLQQIVDMWNYANIAVPDGTTTPEREARLLTLHTQLDAANNLHHAPLCQ